jgi:hypothetical protein
MPFVVERLAFTGRAEWLARATSGPDFAVVWPSGEAQGIVPDSDAGEPVALGVSSDVVGPNICN